MYNEIEKYLKKKYEFRYDVIKSKTSFKKKNKDDEFKEVNDFFYNSLKRELNNKGYRITRTDLMGLLNSDYVETYNPFEHYFQSLPEYDGQKDYIDELAETVQTTNNDFFRWSFKKWLVGMVACALEKETTNQQVIVLSGKQGCGKTSWFNNLIPQDLKAYVYKGVTNPDNKDTKIAMSENMIMNMDELTGLNKKQVESFKEMITLDKITERKPYGLSSEEYPRVCSFVGSTNDNEILFDVTGNRRFLCSEAIDIKYNHNIDLKLVYSQAYHLYKSGFQHYFDSKDTLRIEENNKMYSKASIENDWINKLFRKTEPAEDGILMTATEIGEFIKNEGAKYHIDPIQIGKILTSDGFEVKRSNGIKRYKLIKLK